MKGKAGSGSCVTFHAFLQLAFPPSLEQSNQIVLIGPGKQHNSTSSA